MRINSLVSPSFLSKCLFFIIIDVLFLSFKSIAFMGCVFFFNLMTFLLGLINVWVTPLMFYSV